MHKTVVTDQYLNERQANTGQQDGRAWRNLILEVLCSCTAETKRDHTGWSVVERGRVFD